MHRKAMPARQPLEMPGCYGFHSTRPAPWDAGRVASTRSRSGSEAPEPGPLCFCAGCNRRRRRSATPGMARGERYVSVDRQSKGGVNFSRMTRRCLAAEVSEGLGRSPGPCHTSSASFLSTPHRFAKVAERYAGAAVRLPSNSTRTSPVGWSVRAGSSSAVTRVITESHSATGLL
jgi:hypothetical protein